MNTTLLWQALLVCVFAIAAWVAVERFEVDQLLTKLAKLVIFVIVVGWVIFKLLPAVF